MTKALMVPLLCGLLIGCSNYERFGSSEPEPKPTKAASTAPHDANGNKAVPLMECRSAACQTECRLERAPKWCGYFKKPA